MLTYGEAQIKNKESVVMVNGNGKVPAIIHRPRMNRAQATKYYSGKLYGFWLANLDDTIPKHKRIKALNYLLGRTNEI